MKGVDPNLDFFVRAPEVLPFWILKDLEVDISTVVGSFWNGPQDSTGFPLLANFLRKLLVQNNILPHLVPFLVFFPWTTSRTWKFFKRRNGLRQGAAAWSQRWHAANKKVGAAPGHRVSVLSRQWNSKLENEAAMSNSNNPASPFLPLSLTLSSIYEIYGHEIFQISHPHISLRR